MTTKERREISRAESTNRDPDFPDSRLAPKRPDCQMASYGVCWYGSNGRITGNSWTSKRKAESVRDAKIAEGTFSGTITSYFAGYAF